MGVLRAVIERAVLTMFHPREDVPRRGTRALQLVRNDHPRHIGQSFEQLLEAFLRGRLVPVALPENVQHAAILIDRPPPVMPLARDRQEHLIQRPRIAGLGAAGPSRIGLVRAKFPAPLPDRLVGDDDSPGEQQRFAIAVAETEPEGEPGAVTDDLGRTSMVLVRVGSP